jgi:hypothetical protein
VTKVQRPEAVALLALARDNNAGQSAHRRCRASHPITGETVLPNEDPSMTELKRIHGVDSGEAAEEARKIRRLQVMISMVMSVIGQDPDLTLEEASELAAGARRAALAMFPGKQLAFDILYKPRLQRLMNERYRLQ